MPFRNATNRQIIIAFFVVAITIEYYGMTSVKTSIKNCSGQNSIELMKQPTKLTGGIQEWYRTLIKERLAKCPHASTFFLYFLPHQQCRNARRMGNCKDGAKWICLDDFEGKTTKRALANNQKCIVYSFGSSDDSCFETAMAEQFDCEIHIFDPTSSTLKDSRWAYHSYGLGGADLQVTKYWNWRTQKPDDCQGCPMKNLPQIMKELGHSWIDILKVDIDGAEWRSFDYIYQTWKQLPANQLQVELTGLDISPTSKDSLAGGFDGVYQFWNNILQDGYQMFQFEPNYGTCNYRPKDRSVSLEYALWRGNSSLPVVTTNHLKTTETQT